MNILDLEAKNESRTAFDFVPIGNNTANARWNYNLQNYPHASVGSFWHDYPVTLTNAPTIATNTATFHNNWIWKIPTNRTSTANYQMITYMNANFAWQSAWSITWGRLRTEGPIASGSILNKTITLTPPPRNL
jgi:hypothetical protein